MISDVFVLSNHGAHDTMVPDFCVRNDAFMRNTRQVCEFSYISGFALVQQC